MNKNFYESVAIINAALEDDQIQPVITHIKDTVINNGGEITDVEDWGRKRLAYPIQKSKSGYYVILRFTSPATLIEKLERMYQLNESIIRYLTIKLNKKDLEHYKKLEAKKTEELENKDSIETSGENNESPKIESKVKTTN